MDLNTEAPSVERNIPISTPDTSTPRERVSVRDTIRNSFAEANRGNERQQTERQEPDTSREPEKEEDTAKEAADTDQGTEPDVEAGAEVEEDTSEERAETAPTAWTKDAKAEWENLPEKVRKEVLKRERDGERGVKLLKEKYKEFDDAVAPYLPLFQQFQKTPGQAVGQLLAWFKALGDSPDAAFPALLDSYNYDVRRLVEAKYPGVINRLNQLEQWYKQVQQNQQRQNGQVNGQAANGQAQNGQVQNGQPNAPIHPQVQQYINQIAQHNKALEERLADIEGNFGNYIQSQNQYYESQNAARTQEMLETWAKDKPHFESVRHMMGHLLSPDPATGRAAIPLTADGKVDLDAAYEMAVYAMPEVRAQILAEQRAKDAAARKAKAEAALKAQQEKTAAAQKASQSLTSSAPGGEIGRKTTPERGMSVRDSLKQAISQLADR